MSQPITLPDWVRKTHVKKLYITTSGGKLTADDIALRLALSLRMNGSADHLREVVFGLVNNVCYEHQPNMKRLARCKDDAKLFDAALKIINRVDALINPDSHIEFKLNEDADE